MYLNSNELSFGKSKTALNVPFFNLDNSTSDGFQLLKSPTFALASFASREKVTLQTGFVFINCFLIVITI